MTDIIAIAGSMRSQPPGVRWVPGNQASTRPPQVSSGGGSTIRLSNLESVRVSYKRRSYPSSLVPLFSLFGIISLFSLLALLAAPLYATKVTATLLLFGLAFGLGGTAWTVTKAASVP